MRQNYKTIALFLGLSLVAVSCQKENEVELCVPITESQTCLSVSYTIDGVVSHISFSDETSWQEFLRHLFVLAEQGHRVSFSNSNRVSGLSKETVTYTTKSQSDAQKWCDRMAKQGFEVTLEYDKSTSTYICTAIR